MSESAYPFNTPLEIMKPAKIKRDNEGHKQKLLACMLSPEYAVEEKLDGHHYTAIGTRFFSPHISEATGAPIEKTANFPHLSEGLDFLNVGGLILDGEIYYPGKKSQHVSCVSNSDPCNALATQERQGFIYYGVYDVLRTIEGKWLFETPFRQRREYLEGIGRKLTEACPHFVVNPIAYGNKVGFIDEILSRGGEGAVLKHLEGLWLPGKRPMWNQMKVKQELEDDVVVMGYLPATRLYTGKNCDSWPFWENNEPVTSHWYHKLVGSLIIGKYRDTELVNVGSVTGMTEAERKEFTDNGDLYIGKVIKIRGMEKTPDGNYRHFNFVEIHGDKNPLECQL